MRSYRTSISSKGQVVIPAELRQRLGLKQGMSATWGEANGTLILTPITERRIKEQMGSLKGKTSMFEDSFEERRRERIREK
jgi:bifunctional DNA-binding transcriptional regulator/antitoxin component of YhaV-PrlF toxin-antitoxin module